MASKQRRPSTPSPGVFPVIDRISPDMRDMLVYIEVDSKLANYKHPEYGDSWAGPKGISVDDAWHDDPQTEPAKVGRFDEHELVHVTPADESGIVRWYYVRRREDQAKYNFEWDTPGTTAEGYESYTRTYVVHRDDVDRYRRAYTDTDNVLQFDGDLCLREGDPDPDFLYQEQHVGYKFTKQTITRIDDEVLDGLFVTINLTFHDLIPKTRVLKDPEFGEIKTTVFYDYAPISIVDYTPTQPDMPEHNLGDLYILSEDEMNPQELAAAGLDEQPNWTIIALNYVEYNEARTLRRTELSTAVIPTEKRSTITADDDFCQITTYVWHDNDTGNIPQAGDEKEVFDPLLQEYVGTGEFTKSVNIEPGVSPEVFKVTEVTVILPTEIKTTITEDDLYCGLHTSVFYDHKDNVELPSLGDIYNDAGQVIDITQQDTDCYGIVRYTIVSGQVPSPKKISERTDNEQCRIVTEVFVDSDDYELPALDSDHYSDTTLKVVDTKETPLGCRGVSNYEVTYAVIPSPPRTREIEDSKYATLTVETSYDLTTTRTLPELGTVYNLEYVTAAEAVDVNCGDLRRFEVTTASIPTPYIVTTNEDNTFCQLETTTWVDLKTYDIPAKGDTFNGRVVVDVASKELNENGIKEISITTGDLPSTKKVTAKTDDELCRIVTETHVDTSASYTLPELLSINPTDSSLKVINTQSTPMGCGDIYNFEVIYAAIPSPEKVDEVEDPEFGRVFEHTFYVDESYTLPAMGEVYDQRRVISARKDEVNCGSLIKVILRTVLVPTVKKVKTTEDLEFCETEEVTYYDLASAALKVSGQLVDGKYILESERQDIDLGEIAKFREKAITLPTPTKVSARKDDDMCEVVTEVFYDTALTYEEPLVGDEHPDDELKKLINKQKQPYGCGEIYKYTNVYAQIPTPPRTSEYDHPDFCRVSFDTYYDLDGDIELPAIGDEYIPPGDENGGSYKVVKAKAEDTDCDGLRRYEVHYITLPQVHEEQVRDKEFCTLTREITITDVTGEMPAPGADYNGETVLESQETNLACDNLYKQVVTTVSLPTVEDVSEKADTTYCTIQTQKFYDKSSNFMKSTGDAHGLGFIVDVTITPMSCGGISRVEYRTAQIPSTPIETVTLDDNYCNVTLSTLVVLTSAKTAYLKGDTYDGRIVIDYKERSLSCAEFTQQEITTIAALPTPVVTRTIDSQTYCDLQRDTYYAEASEETPVIGNSYGSGYIIRYEEQKTCHDIKSITIDHAVLPSEKKTTETTHDLFCEVESITWQDLATSDTTYSRGDDYDGKIVIDFQATPNACGVIMTYELTAGSVPSEALEGREINQVTGERETFTTKVVKSADIEDETMDVDEQGNYKSAKPYGCGLSIIKEGVIKPFDTLEYHTTVNYTFPRVLGELAFYVWPLRKGGIEMHTQWYWEKNGYSGPCSARIVEEWHFEIPEVVEPFVMMPTPLNYSCPQFRVATGPCLHGSITFFCNFGTSDKKYKLTANSDFTIAATNYTDWPTAEFVGAWTCKPAYGGFITRTVHITPPS
jgi:hypothetical protein